MTTNLRERSAARRAYMQRALRVFSRRVASRRLISRFFLISFFFSFFSFSFLFQAFAYSAKGRAVRNGRMSFVNCRAIFTLFVSRSSQKNPRKLPQSALGFSSLDCILFLFVFRYVFHFSLHIRLASPRLAARSTRRSLVLVKVVKS